MDVTSIHEKRYPSWEHAEPARTLEPVCLHLCKNITEADINKPTLEGVPSIVLLTLLSHNALAYKLLILLKSNFLVLNHLKWYLCSNTCIRIWQFFSRSCAFRVCVSPHYQCVLSRIAFRATGKGWGQFSCSPVLRVTAPTPTSSVPAQLCCLGVA